MDGRSPQARAMVAVAAVLAAAGAVTGGLLLGNAPPPATGGRPAASSPGPGGRPAEPSASPSPRLAAVPSATSSPRLAAVASGSEAAAVANVRAFYSGYPGAAAHGEAAVDALIRARVASWYAPILAASPGSAGPPGCGEPWTTAPQYQPAGVVAGEDIVVLRWHTAQQALYIVAAAQPRTGKITGLSCAIGGNDVTSTGATDAAKSLYTAYILGRRRGISTIAELRVLVSGGPDSGSAYLQQALNAYGRRTLGYDPLLCRRAGVPDLSVRSADVVAGGSAGLVTVESGRALPVLAVVVLSAQGWAVADIACQQP